MTLLGKILVILLTMFSAMAAVLTLFLFLYEKDWYTMQPQAHEEPGEVAKRSAEIRQLNASLDTVEARWTTNRQELGEWEHYHLQNLDFYDKEMEKVVNGDAPLQEVIYEGGRVTLVNPRNKGLPVMKDVTDWAGKPLRSNRHYSKEWTSAVAAAAKAMKQLQDLIEEEGQLTGKLVGPKGLKQRVVDEDKKFQKVVKELDEVKRLWANEHEATSTLYNQQKQLKTRLRELEDLLGLPPPRP